MVDALVMCNTIKCFLLGCNGMHWWCAMLSNAFVLDVNGCTYSISLYGVHTYIGWSVLLLATGVSSTNDWLIFMLIFSLFTASACRGSVRSQYVRVNIECMQILTRARCPAATCNLPVRRYEKSIYTTRTAEDITLPCLASLLLLLHYATRTLLLKYTKLLYRPCPLLCYP